MKIQFEILPPKMPNFVRFKSEAQLKQDGFKVDEGYPISKFTEEEAHEFADMMRNEFINHWKEKQPNKNHENLKR